jgi:signal transduction histidine kinase
VQGGLWLGFFNGGIEYFRDGEVRASFGATDGLGEGRVSRFGFDQDGTVWAATEGGLSRLKNARAATLSSKNGLPCDAVHWAIRDNDHAFWLYMPCGLVRIARSELDAWAAAADRDKDTKPMVQATVFDSSVGVTSRAGISRFDFGHFRPGGYTPHVAKSSDGKLWFSSGDGVSVVDPHHLPFNPLRPPVHIEKITADRKVSWQNLWGTAASNLRLPALSRDLQIDYTALSLVAPEMVRFKYQLEGEDKDWQYADNRRQAFYTNLAPRHFRFHVIACNNSGVWNEAGAYIDFSIAPAYYQTRWFQASCVAGFLALLWGLHRYRLRQIARELNVRLEGRLAERARIARELHDTLLQSFQALLLKFHTVTYLLDRPAEARKRLEGTIEEATQAMKEGRDAVQGMRSSTVVINDLARAITMVGEQLAADQTGRKFAEFRLAVEGATRDLVPLVRDEVNRIACEAVRNAFNHARASRIEVELHYDKRRFRLRVRDDGKGMDPQMLAEGKRAGHFGLPGMHERAELTGGKLAVWSEPDSGTEIELTIPAAIAYAKSPGHGPDDVVGTGNLMPL